MADILSAVMGQLDQNTLAGIAKQLGTNPQQAQGAVQAALPLILGAMGRNAATPQGADALHNALSRDHSHGDMMGVIGSVLGGALGGGAQQQASNPLLSIGKSVLGGILGGGAQPQQPQRSFGMQAGQAILGHVFGGQQQRAQQGLGQVTGLGGDGAGKLMAMLAPIIMSVLGKQVAGGMNSQVLGQVLGQNSQTMRQHAPTGGMMSAILDRDGDGDVDLADLMANAGMIGKIMGK